MYLPVKIALKAANDRYVVAENGGDDRGIVHADRTAVGPWETWTVERQPDGRIALKSVNGLYLSAEGGGGGEVHANRRQAGPWEHWRPFGGGLQSDNGHWLVVELGAPDLPVNANRTSRGPWETFRTELLDARLRVDGLDFRDESGQKWVMRGCSDFLLFQRFLDGQDIEPALHERAAVGANCLRVFGMFDGGLGRFHPGDYPNFDAGVQAFTDLLAQHAFYVFWVVFADAQIVMPSVPDQQQWLAHFRDLVRGRSNVLLELANENFKNGVNAANFSKPDGVLSCSGSGGAGMDPPQPFWDWSDLHPERGDKWPLSSTTLFFAINGFGGPFPGTHQATVAGEPIGFADNADPGRRANDPQAAYRLGADSALWGAGGVFHSESGATSTIFTLTQRACAQAFLRGVRAVEDH